VSSNAAAVRLRELIAGETLLHAPGTFDAVSAALAREAGFEVAYLSGAVVSATSLGLPDMGYVQAGDIVEQARRMLPALGPIPLVADADTGYGNALQARRTAELYSRAGIAALHIEDQVSPKRCGHMAGKAVVATGEANERIRAAVESDGDIVVIARTDALGVLGLDAALVRAREYAAAGAEMIFVEGASDPAWIRRVAAAVPGVPLVFNRSEAGGPVTAEPGDDELYSLGVRMVIHPVSALLAAARAVREAYAEIRSHGAAAASSKLTWDEVTDLVGLPRVLELETRYAGAD